MTELTAETFWPFVRARSHAVVQFWAPWNSAYDVPLRQRLEELLPEHGSISFGRLNLDEAPAVASELRVMNLPAIGYFSEGHGAVEIGLRDKEWISGKLKDLVRVE